MGVNRDSFVQCVSFGSRTVKPRLFVKTQGDADLRSDVKSVLGHGMQ